MKFQNQLGRWTGYQYGVIGVQFTLECENQQQRCDFLLARSDFIQAPSVKLFLLHLKYFYDDRSALSVELLT